VANQNERASAESSESGDDRRIIAKPTVAVELDEVFEETTHVIEHVRTIRMSRELDLLPGLELCKELARKLRGPLFEPVKLGLQRSIGPCHLAKLAYACDQVDDRPFERQNIVRSPHRETQTLAWREHRAGSLQPHGTSRFPPMVDSARARERERRLAGDRFGVIPAPTEHEAPRLKTRHRGIRPKTGNR
jgi:hypothetical protein